MPSLIEIRDGNHSKNVKLASGFSRACVCTLVYYIYIKMQVKPDASFASEGKNVKGKVGLTLIVFTNERTLTVILEVKLTLTHCRAVILPQTNDKDAQFNDTTHSTLGLHVQCEF